MTTARRLRQGLGAFNVVQLEHAEAIVAAAERTRLPVILQISQNTVDYHGGLAPLARAAIAQAEQASVKVVVHLDHATRPDLVREAVELGIESVMFDASALSYDDNVALTAETTQWCHARAVWVEGELGEVGGKGSAHAPGVRTDPDEAASFVEATGVDALAVAVGSAHAMRKRVATLDFGLIARIAAQVPVPLVLHGSSGVPDDALQEAVTAGMTKINVGTALNQVMTAAVRAALELDPDVVDPRGYLGKGRDAVDREVGRLLEILTRSP